LLAKVESYYTEKLREHGATPRGVDWITPESQRLRFEQLARLWGTEQAFSLNDLGCGYGALVDYLRERGLRVEYTGTDLSDAMLAAARRLHDGEPGCRFTRGGAPPAPADYSLASGVFNVRLDVGLAEWERYVTENIDALAAQSRKGFAFNALTTHCDAERRRADLYYADPLALFDYCRRRHSRRVALLHDYPLWEFTVVVKLDGAR
jgi:SAM-dependent methyltransferase